MLFDSAGVFTFTPVAGQTGSPTFTYTVTDKDGDSAVQTVTINLAGDTGPLANVTVSSSTNQFRTVILVPVADPLPPELVP